MSTHCNTVRLYPNEQHLALQVSPVDGVNFKEKAQKEYKFHNISMPIPKPEVELHFVT